MSARDLLGTLAAQAQAQGGTLKLDAHLAGVGGWASVLEALGAPALALEAVVVDQATGHLRGHATVVGKPASVDLALADADGGIGASLAADLGDARVALPGATTFALTGAGLSIHAPGSGGPLAGDIHATLTAGTVVVPVSVPLPSAASGWIIQGSFEQRPVGLDALAGLLGGRDLAASLPAALGDAAASLALTGLEVRCNATLTGIDRVSVTIASTASWPVIPDQVVLREPSICFSLLPGSDDIGFAVLVRGTLQAGNAVVPISLVRDADAMWRIAIATTALPLPSLSALRTLVSDRTLLQTPEGWADSGSVALTAFDLAIDGTARTVRSLHIGVSADAEWQVPFVPGLRVSDAMLDVTADYAGGGGVSAAVAGTVQIAGVKLQLSGTRSGAAAAWELLEGTLDDANMPIGDVVRYFLPGIAAPVLDVTRLSVRVEPVARRFSVSADLRGPWKVSVGRAELRVDGLTASIGAKRTEDEVKPIGSVHGAATFAGVSFTLDCVLGDTLRIQTTLPTLNLTALLTAAGVPRPTFLPEIELANVSLDVTPETGAFAVGATLASPFEIPIGGGALRVETLNAHVERSPSGVACRLALGVGPLTAGDQFSLEGFTLTFDGGSGDWTARGAVAGTVFGTSFAFAASYEEQGSTSVLTLTAHVDAPTDLLALSGVGSLGVNDLALRVETTTQNGSTTRRWHAEAGGHAQLTLGGAGLDTAGHLVLDTDDGRIGLAFVPERAHVTVPLDPIHPDRPAVALQLDILKLGVSRSAQAGWGFDAAVDLGVTGLPPGLERYLPEDPIKTTLRAGANAVTLTADPVMAPFTFAIPPITRGGATLDLGEAAVLTRSLSISLGTAVDLSADLYLGLPANLNYVFGARSDGTPAANVFRVYNPADRDPQLFGVRLGVGSDGVTFQVLSSPFTFLTAEGGHADLDVEDVCRLGFTLPKLALDPATQTFATDVALDIERLAIPLGPLRALLRAFKLDAVAKALPTSLPFEPIDFVDARGQLRVPELIALLQKTGGAKLPKAFTDALKALAEVVDRLPAGLTRYLRIGWPEEVRLRIATTASGSLRLDFAVGEKSEPLRFVFPSMSGPFPALVGVELYGVAFGEVFGGALLIVEVDARIDQFNLPTIVGALALPAGGAPVIPAGSGTLQNRLILDKLFAIVFYQAGVPIPIPLFYDELGVEYWGIEGLRYQGHIRLPMPRFNLTEAVRQIGVFKRFFTEPDYYLDEQAAPKDMNLVFSTGLNYIELPQYLGGGMLGDKQPGPSLNAYSKAAQLLNLLKRVLARLQGLTINDVIQLIPLDDRVLVGEIGAAGLSANGAFALTTPAEFAETAYRRLDVDGAQIKDALAVLPAPTGEPVDETGLCLFFKGGFALGDAVTFEAMYAVAATGTRFGTGFGVRGALGNGTVDALLQGQFTVDPAQPVPVGLAGTARLAIAGTPIADGEVSLGNAGFHLRAMLDLFPGNRSVQVKGRLEGDVGPGGAELAGKITFKLGATFTLAGASVQLDPTRFSVTGICLDQSLTFAIQRFERRAGKKQVTGLRFSAELAPITIGAVFRLTGAGPQGGPHAALEVAFGPAFGVELSGAMVLLDIAAASTTVRLTERGYEFSVSGKLLKVFACTVEAVAGDLTKGNGFALQVAFAGGAIGDVLAESLRLLASAAAEASRQLETARGAVATAQRDVDAAIASAQREVTKAKAAVKVIQGQIRNVDKKVSGVRKKMKKYKYNPIKLAELTTQLTALGLERGGREVELRGAQLGLAIAQAVLQFARSGTAVVGYVLRGVLRTIKQQADAARKRLAAAQRALAQLERRLGVAAQLVGYRGTLLAIKSIGFSAALTRIQGVAVALDFDVTFLGKRRSERLRAKLVSPGQLAQVLVRAMLGR